MSDLDIKIFCLILKKEDAFEKELSELTALIKSEILLNELSDYKSGLSDLKNDFLLPAKASIQEDRETASRWIADQYWLLRRI